MTPPAEPRKTTLLTIGIPTYNRPCTVLRLIASIFEELDLDVDVLVINDGEKEIDAELINRIGGDRVFVLSNIKNLGYAKTFIKIFENCRSDYLMMMADDDFLSTNDIAKIKTFLENKSPDFVSTQFKRNGEIYRGSTTTRKVLTHEFFSASAHAPGLIYRVPSCQKALNFLAHRISEKASDALTYPQVLLVAYLIATKKKCYWLDCVAATEGSAEPSNIKDADGRSYFSSESRLKQMIHFDESVERIFSEYDDTSTRDAMLRSNSERALSMLLSALRCENPIFFNRLDSCLKRYYLRVWIRDTLKGILPSILYEAATKLYLRFAVMRNTR